MKVIVLCGGLGTRLGNLTYDTPKPAIIVAGRPFIAHVLDQLLSANPDEFVLAVSFQWKKLQTTIGHQWRGVKVRYSVELGPLGTGGAILQAMRQANVNEALVANGDTLLKLDAATLVRFAYEHDADIAIALKEMENISRFGKVRIDEASRIIAFEEKISGSSGLINSGLYYLRSSIFDGVDTPAFSLETEILTRQYNRLRMYGMPTKGYFIDMGVPEDLARAQQELTEMHGKTNV
ncbi:MAG: sugar phosphate nucleotidyltransferase [Azonexus sp.]